jgi:methyl-accepting chemotaxis protein
MAVAMMALAAIGVATAALINMGSMQERSDYMYGQTLVPITNLAKMQQAALNMRGSLLNAAVSTDRAQISKFLADSKAQDAPFDQALAAYTSTDMTGREKSVDQVKQATAAIRQLRDAKLAPAIENGDRAEFLRVRDTEAGPVLNDLNAGVEQLIETETGAARARNVDSRTTYNSARAVVIIFVALGVLLAGVASFLITRAITGPLSRCVAVLKRVQGGDLTARSELTGRDEVAQLAEALDASTV